MKENVTVRLLNEIYRKCKTAVDAIDIAENRCSNGKFRDILILQREIYCQIADKAGAELCRYNILPADGGIMAKLELWSAVNVGTFADRSNENIAEIMINGSMMGMIDITKFINRYKNADLDVVRLAQRLIRTERNNIEVLQEYLE